MPPHEAAVIGFGTLNPVWIVLVLAAVAWSTSGRRFVLQEGNLWAKSQPFGIRFLDGNITTSHQNLELPAYRRIFVLICRCIGKMQRFRGPDEFSNPIR